MPLCGAPHEGTRPSVLSSDSLPECSQSGSTSERGLSSRCHFVLTFALSLVEWQVTKVQRRSGDCSMTNPRPLPTLSIGPNLGGNAPVTCHSTGDQVEGQVTVLTRMASLIIDHKHGFGQVDSKCRNLHGRHSFVSKLISLPSLTLQYLPRVGDPSIDSLCQFSTTGDNANVRRIGIHHPVCPAFLQELTKQAYRRAGAAVGDHQIERNTFAFPVAAPNTGGLLGSRQMSAAI